jgi:hypothetical protein
MMEWRKLHWLPDYEISEAGDIRRSRKVRSHVAGKHLSLCRCNKGYLHVSLVAADGRRRRLLAHRLVCEAWHGSPPVERPFAAHSDGTKTNNHYTNLRWATHAENEADKRLHGTFRPRAKITAADVIGIRQHRLNGLSPAELAEIYGVARSTIYGILKGARWAREAA